jgi:hypothetical protein
MTTPRRRGAASEPCATNGPVHNTFAEYAVVSDACQRWRLGQHSFVRARDGGFNASSFTIEAIDEATAKRYCTSHHYAGSSYPAAMHRFGLYRLDAPPPPAGWDSSRDDGAALVGVAVFSVPASKAVITKPFPELDYSTACELGRLVLESPAPGDVVRAPANSESWFVARCFEELASRGVRGVVSFADPVPRRNVVTGEIVKPGHVGIVYQALGQPGRGDGTAPAGGWFRYTGRGTARYVVMLGDGQVISERALQKVRGAERGHEYVERRLVALGASPPRTGSNMAEWLTGALEDVGARRVKHRGNHRFVATLGNRRERRDVQMALPALPYPKCADPEEGVASTLPAR